MTNLARCREGDSSYLQQDNGATVGRLGWDDQSRSLTSDTCDWLEGERDGKERLIVKAQDSFTPLIERILDATYGLACCIDRSADGDLLEV